MCMFLRDRDSTFVSNSVIETVLLAICIIEMLQPDYRMAIVDGGMHSFISSVRIFDVDDTKSADA